MLLLALLKVLEHTFTMRYFLGFLAAVALVIVVFILVIRGFTGNHETTKDAFVLADHASTSMVVELTADGRINADQDHVGYHITVDRNQTKLEVYKGYQNQVTDVKSYANNDDAYGAFLRALDLAGYSKGNDESKNTDERGVCANGVRYVYEIKNGPHGDKRYWSSSCGGGTFKGKGETVRGLFERQIPDFSAATSRLDLY